MKSELGLKVSMSDGAVLLVDVYSPADSIAKVAGQKFPVLLTQSPYAFMNAAPHLGYIDYYVKRGYICVVAHIRGTNGSGGKNEFLSSREQEDGPELVYPTPSWKWKNRLVWNFLVGIHSGIYCSKNWKKFSS